MYISIDLNKMRFLHKHQNFQVVANLDYIACRETDLSHIDAPGIFFEYTDQELALLYRHVTNSDHVPAIGDSLRMVLMELAERFPVTDVDPLEAEAQALHIESTRVGARDAYAYVKGSRVPRRTDDMLFADPVPFSSAELGSTLQKHGQRLQQRANAVAVATPAPSPSAPVAPRKAAAPRSGVCKQIWETLDNACTPDGVPPTRAQVKDLATQFGWNSSTASVQYAAWRKAKNLP